MISFIVQFVSNMVSTQNIDLILCMQFCNSVVSALLWIEGWQGMAGVEQVDSGLYSGLSDGKT